MSIPSHDNFRLSFTDLPSIAAAVTEATPCNRIYLCGPGPADLEEFLLNSGMFRDYRLDKHGHYIDHDNARGHVERFAHRAFRKALEVRTIDNWLGPDVRADDACQSMELLRQSLKGGFRSHAPLMGSPSSTFKTLYRPRADDFPPLAPEIQRLIHSTSGQGRIEILTRLGIKKIPQLRCYDARFAYAALCWGLPSKLLFHDIKSRICGEVARMVSGQVHRARQRATCRTSTLGVIGPTPVELLAQEGESAVFTSPQKTLNDAGTVAFNGKFDINPQWSVVSNFYMPTFEQCHTDGNDSDIQQCSANTILSDPKFAGDLSLQNSNFPN